MKDEIEVTFLEIDIDDIRKKLKEIGAQHEGEHHSRRKLFDYPGLPLEKQDSWLRLRDNGGKVTLTFKKVVDGVMKEAEIIVSDFDTTADILTLVGLSVKRYEENKREEWVLGEYIFDIDTWPLLPTYVEIEGPSLEGIQNIVEKLGFDWVKRVEASPLKVYAHYGYDLKKYA